MCARVSQMSATLEKIASINVEASDVASTAADSSEDSPAIDSSDEEESSGPAARYLLGKKLTAAAAIALKRTANSQRDAALLSPCWRSSAQYSVRNTFISIVDGEDVNLLSGTARRRAQSEPRANATSSWD